jgi:ribosome-binding factor A
VSRNIRFAELLKQEISRILRTEVSDPRIGFVSITDIDVSPDIKNAKIYVSVMGNETEKKASLAGLTSATSFIRSSLAKVLETRTAPEIVFCPDSSLERGSKVLEILSKMHANDKKPARTNKKSAKKS